MSCFHRDPQSQTSALPSLCLPFYPCSVLPSPQPLDTLLLTLPGPVQLLPPTQSRPQSFRTCPAELLWSSRAHLPRGKVSEHGQNHGLRMETAWIRITALLPMDILGPQCAHLESEDDSRTYLGRVVGMAGWMNTCQGVDSGHPQPALEICELNTTVGPPPHFP